MRIQSGRRVEREDRTDGRLQISWLVAYFKDYQLGTISITSGLLKCISKKFWYEEEIILNLFKLNSRCQK
jgi:hypothetical protein